MHVYIYMYVCIYIYTLNLPWFTDWHNSYLLLGLYTILVRTIYLVGFIKVPKPDWNLGMSPQIGYKHEFSGATKKELDGIGIFWDVAKTSIPYHHHHSRTRYSWMLCLDLCVSNVWQSSKTSFYLISPVPSYGSTLHDCWPNLPNLGMGQG